eukprot:150015-Amphidinium_carterae.1
MNPLLPRHSAVSYDWVRKARAKTIVFLPFQLSNKPRTPCRTISSTKTVNLGQRCFVLAGPMCRHGAV